MDKRYWRIRGYKGLSPPFFDMTIGIGHFSVDRVNHLLQTLAAKEDLTYEEIVRAYAARGTKTANSLLRVDREPDQPIYRCGQDSIFTAAVVDGSGKVIRGKAG